MSGSKGLGNINNYVKTYDGTDPSIFKTFLEDFQLGVDALDIPPKKQYLVLMNCLSGTPKEIAMKFIKQYKTDNANWST